jgi:hypothetical protein
VMRTFPPFVRRSATPAREESCAAVRMGAGEDNGMDHNKNHTHAPTHPRRLIETRPSPWPAAHHFSRSAGQPIGAHALRNDRRLFCSPGWGAGDHGCWGAGDHGLPQGSRPGEPWSPSCTDDSLLLPMWCVLLRRQCCEQHTDLPLAADARFEEQVGFPRLRHL